MKTAGFVKSLYSGEYIERQEAWPVTALIFRVLGTLVSILFSWLHVVLWLAQLWWRILNLYDQRSAPPLVRELSWRYTYVPLSLQDLMRLNVELTRAKLGRDLTDAEMEAIREGFERRLGLDVVRRAAPPNPAGIEPA